MSFQIRHTAQGIFQGQTLSGLIWFNISGRPELGFMEFPNKETAEQYVKQTILAKPLDDSDRLSAKDISIEPFDTAANTKLMTSQGGERRRRESLLQMNRDIAAYPHPPCIVLTTDGTGFVARYKTAEGVGKTCEEAVGDLLGGMLKTVAKGK